MSGIKQDTTDILFSPTDAARAHLEYAKGILNSEGLEWPLECMNKDTLPLRPGTMATILGRPGMGKSTLLGLVGKHHAKKIMESPGAGLDKVIVHVTWEQSIEELEAFYQADGDYTVSDIAWGKVPLRVLEQRAAQRISLPVWMIGLSVTRRQTNTRMFLDTVLKTILSLEKDYNVKPLLLLLDYIQIIPLRGRTSRVDQVTEVAPKVKEVALQTGAPVLVGVQASREVDLREWKVPTQRDAQWSSGIEQASDVMFGIWRPTVSGTKTVRALGKSIDVDENLLILERLKQRGEKARSTWVLNLDPSTVWLSERSLTENIPPGYPVG